MNTIIFQPTTNKCYLEVPEAEATENYSESLVAKINCIWTFVTFATIYDHLRPFATI